MHYISRRQLILVLLAVVVTVAACGQKGPLYMPDEKQDEQQQHNEQNQSKS